MLRRIDTRRKGHTTADRHSSNTAIWHAEFQATGTTLAIAANRMNVTTPPATLATSVVHGAAAPSPKSLAVYPLVAIATGQVRQVDPTAGPRPVA